MRSSELAPDGVDVFYDNVGGSILDTVLFQIRERGRVVICGAISQYEHMDQVAGPSNYLKLAERHARMEGFAVFHFAARYGEAENALAGWLAEGRLLVHRRPPRKTAPPGLLKRSLGVQPSEKPVG